MELYERYNINSTIIVRFECWFLLDRLQSLH